ncbi:MAG: hypothetical protein ABSG86_16955 [Thermoguttaceae bacterium]|jgi:hypothetical protein
MCRCKSCYLAISGVIFLIVTVLHALRLVYKVPVQIGDRPLPDWSSWAGAVGAGILCIWAFWLLCGVCCCHSCKTETPPEK